jgi:hypothetical protein
MSQPAAARSTTPSPGARGTSGWVGWIAFAGFMMVMLGMFQVLEGIVSLANDQYFLGTPNRMVLHLGYTTWGWLHLIGGAVVVVAGVGVFAGQTWARVVGTVVAVVSALLNLAFLAAYPIWSTLMIGLAVVVVMALTVHGSEIKAGT